QALGENRGIAPPEAQPFRQALELAASDRRLHLGHAPVGAERFVHPAEARWVLASMHRIVALAVILVRPGGAPKILVGGGQKAAFAGRGHDLVLAEGEGRHIAEAADWPAVVRRTVRLRAVLDQL